MKKYVAEWSFADSKLKFYDALSFLTGDKTRVCYELRHDGFYSIMSDGTCSLIEWANSLDPFEQQHQFYDELTINSLVYVKGTFFDNMLIKNDVLDENRLMSFFETLVIAFRQKGLILDDSHLDGIDQVYEGFRSAWLGETNAPWDCEGKVLTFKVDILNFG